MDQLHTAGGWRRKERHFPAVVVIPDITESHKSFFRQCVKGLLVSLPETAPSQEAGPFDTQCTHTGKGRTFQDFKAFHLPTDNFKREPKHEQVPQTFLPLK